jgi:hypothetical protein
MTVIFKLVLEDGTPANPPRLDTGVPNWRAGDVIPIGRDRVLRPTLMLRLLGKRESQAARALSHSAKPPGSGP